MSAEVYHLSGHVLADGGSVGDVVPFLKASSRRSLSLRLPLGETLISGLGGGGAMVITFWEAPLWSTGFVVVRFTSPWWFVMMEVSVGSKRSPLHIRS